MTDHHDPADLPPALQELIASAVAAGLVVHIEERHAFSTEDVSILVTEHRELYDGLRPDMAMIVVAMYGEHKPTVVDPDFHTGGLVDDMGYLSNQIDGIARNGNGTTREWGVGEWSVAGAIIGACGAFVTAVVVILISAALGG